jgi:hypothetical protein
VIVAGRVPRSSLRFGSSWDGILASFLDSHVKVGSTCIFVFDYKPQPRTSRLISRAIILNRPSRLEDRSEKLIPISCGRSL